MFSLTGAPDEEEIEKTMTSDKADAKWVSQASPPCSFLASEEENR